MEYLNDGYNNNRNTMYFKIHYCCLSMLNNYLYLSNNCTKIIILVKNHHDFLDNELTFSKNVRFIECSGFTICTLPFGKNLKHLNFTSICQNYVFSKYLTFVKIYLASHYYNQINFPKSITYLDLGNITHIFIKVPKKCQYISYGMEYLQSVILPKHIQYLSLRQSFDIRTRKGNHSIFWSGANNDNVILPSRTKIVSLGCYFTTNIILPESVTTLNTSRFSNVLDNLPNSVNELHYCEKTDNLYNLPKSKKSFKYNFYKR